MATLMPVLLTANFTMPEQEISPLLREKFTWKNTRPVASSSPPPESSGISLIDRPVASCDAATFFKQAEEGGYVLVAASYCLRGKYHSECYFFAPADRATISPEFLELRSRVQEGFERLLRRAWTIRRLDKNFSNGKAQIEVNFNQPQANGKAKNQLVFKDSEASVEFKPQPTVSA